MEQDSNEKLTPVFVGEELVWIQVTEYYAKYMGNIAIGETEWKNQDNQQ